ncbi:hypothetical protein K438DRAFT_796670 [Mycena galopus ATCC 62051]|nr:hypothetical protein K438DRAFT_796670 [Mycena galopus ATCC 62051]
MYESFLQRKLTQVLMFPRNGHLVSLICSFMRSLLSCDVLFTRIRFDFRIVHALLYNSRLFSIAASSFLVFCPLFMTVTSSSVPNRRVQLRQSACKTW